jgi:outer membrane protein
MKKFLIIIFLYINCNCWAVTLNEALEAAYENNVTLKADREALKVKDEDIMEIISRMLPSVSIKKIKENGKQVPSQERQVAGEVTQKNNGITGYFDLSQNLFRGGADVSSLIAVRNAIEAARADLMNKEQVALQSVVESFFKLKALNSKYLNAKKMETQTKEYVVATDQRFSVGEVTKTDVARAQAAYASSKARKSNYWAGFVSEKVRFKNMTGLEVNDVMSSNSDKDIKIPSSVDEAIGRALKNNPNMLIADFTRKSSAAQVKANMGALLPKVDLRHQVGDLSRDRLRGNDKGYKLNQVTSLEVTVPIFDGGSNWSKVRAAKRRDKQSQYNSMNINNEITQRATAAWFGLDASRDILKSRKDALEASKVAYEGAREEEKAGIRASIDVVNAHHEYFQSYEQYVDAETDYYLSVYRLKAEVGECTAQGLNLKVKLYDPLANYNRIKFQLIGAY